MTDVDERSIDERMHALAAPLHELLAEVETELAEVQARLDQLRADRSKLRTALRAADPTFEPETKPGPKGRKTPANVAGVEALAKAQELLPQLAAEFDGDGFTSTALAAHDAWPFSQSYSSMILNTLQDRGVVRLDHVVGTRKHFKLV